MTNKEAAEKLKEILFMTGYKEALNLAIKALDVRRPICPVEFPTEDDPYPVCSYIRPTGEWIPVSERLPEIATRCIVQLSNGYITIGEYFSSEIWTLIETSIQFIYPKETVTAWMPLPQPYKKEAEND